MENHSHPQELILVEVRTYFTADLREGEMRAQWPSSSSWINVGDLDSTPSSSPAKVKDLSLVPMGASPHMPELPYNGPNPAILSHQNINLWE